MTHIHSTVISQLPLGLKLLVDNIATLKMVSQALQAVCKVYAAQGLTSQVLGNCCCMAGCHRCLWFVTCSQDGFIGLVDSHSMCQQYKHCSELCSPAYVTSLQLDNTLHSINHTVK